MGLIINQEPHEFSESIILQYSGLKLLGRVGKEGVITKEVVQGYAKEFEWIA